MKQPKIKIFGGIYPVRAIEFDREGTIVRIVYNNDKLTQMVFKRDEMIDKSLTSDYKINEPTRHPYHDYAYAPDLESLLLYRGDKFQCEECQAGFAIKEDKAPIDEPICPVCTSDNVRDGEKK